MDNNLDHDLDDDSDDFGDDDFGDLDYDDADDAEYDDEYDDEYEAEWAAVHAMDNGHAHQHRPQDLPQDQLQTKSRLESLRLQAKPSSNFKGTAYPPGSYMVPPPVQSTPATYALCVGPTFDVPVASATPALTDPLWMQPERSASAPKSTPVIYPLFSEGRALSTALPGAHALTEGTGKYVRLPRAYGLACFPGTSDAWHAALLSRLETRETLRFFRGLLFPYQSAAVDHVLRALRESAVHGGLLEAACGAGKTTMALYIASVLGVPVMVLVHTGKLLEQWLLRVAQYLPNARVGTLQGKTRPSADCDVCIGMLQTVMNLETTVKGYGLLVVDECHHISASSFSKAVAKFSAPYRLGLTATAQRGDGTVHAIEWLIGQRLYRIACTSVRVGVLAVAYDNPAFEHAVRKWDKTKMDWVSTLTRIVSDAWRTRRIAELLYELVVIEGRRVVAISSRVSLLEDLHALLPGSGLIAGKNKSGKDEPLLLASQSLVAEGVDDQRLDTLVLLTPVKVAKDDERLITQAVGRVQERGGVTKARPSLVVDFYDKYQMFHGMFRARRKWYADNGFTFRRPRTVGPPLVRQAVLGTIPARDATNVGLGPRALVGEQADVPADNGIQADSTVSVPVADQAVRIAEPTALCGAPDTRDEPAYTVSPLPPTVPDVKTLYDLRDNVLRAPFPPLPGYVPKMEPVSKPRGKKAQGIVQGNACTAQGAVPVVPGTGSTAPVPGSTASGRRPRAKKAQDPDLAKRPRAKKCAKPAQSVEQTEQSAKPSSRKRKATAPSTGTTTTSAS